MHNTGKLHLNEIANGFSIVHIHRDRPPKVKFGEGYRFFTNEKFGCLVTLAKLVKQDRTINAACEESGVSLWRARRFLKGIGLTFRHAKKEHAHEKICDICLKPMIVNTRRQKRHAGECLKKWTNDYYKGYARKCRTKH